MKVETLVVGMIQTNCYIVYDEDSKQGVIIDPGAASERILARVAALGLDIKYVLLTHGHFDHILALQSVCDKTGAEVYIHPGDKYLLSPEVVKNFGVNKSDYKEPEETLDLVDGGIIEVGGLKFDVLNTKGHSEGSCVFLCGEYMFSGDTLFLESCGRTDFEGSDPHAMMASLKRLHDLPGEYKVCPGHEETSTLSHEREHNPYMKMAVEQL